MLSCLYKNLAPKYGLLSKNLQNINYHISNFNINKFNKWGSLVDRIGNKYNFSSKKQNIPIEKNEKNLVQQKKNQQQSDFLWKLSLVLNIIGTGAGFYFPKEALLLILTSNSMFQICESSKSTSVIQQLIYKATKKTSEESANTLPLIKQQLKKVLITMGFVLVASITISLGLNYPSITDYSLLGLNFWILFNIKFNGLSHGYYFVLLTLAAFQYLYFQKVFQSNKQKLPFQRS